MAQETGYGSGRPRRALNLARLFILFFSSCYGTHFVYPLVSEGIGRCLRYLGTAIGSFRSGLRLGAACPANPMQRDDRPVATCSFRSVKTTWISHFRVSASRSDRPAGFLSSGRGNLWRSCSNLDGFDGMRKRSRQTHRNIRLFR